MSANETVAARYSLDASRSRFAVQVTAQGLFSAFGHNPTIAIRGFGGDARFNPGSLESASLLMLVRVDSLAVVNDVSEKDRREIERIMREEVLDSAHYPEIVYMSRSVNARPSGGQDRYQVSINGDLTLRGTTRNERVDAQVTVTNESLRAQGEFTLRQTDYNIKPVSVAAGALKVKDEIKLSFDIIAQR